MAVTQIRPHHQTVTREDTALFIPVGMLFEDWEREAKKVQRHHRSTMWHLGDIFLAGQERFGEIYAQAVEDYSEDSIMRAMPVSRIFPPQRRRKCGWSFHYSVKNLTEREQDELLDAADKNKWTRETFREVLRERKAEQEAVRSPRLLEGPTPEPAPTAEPPAPANDEILASDNLRAPTPEAEGSNNPVTAAEAVVLLEQFAASPVVPPAVRAAFHVLIDERDTLLKIANSAKLSIEMAKGFVSPKLRDAVQAWESHLTEPAPAAS